MIEFRRLSVSLQLDFFPRLGPPRHDYESTPDLVCRPKRIPAAAEWHRLAKTRIAEPIRGGNAVK